MIPRYVPVLLILILVAATGLFRVKYAVVSAEGEIVRIEREIEAERWRLKTLEADWAYLVRADRLTAQARALDMQPLRLSRVVQAEQIGNYRNLELAREARSALLPDGEAIEFRVKPVATFDLGVLEPRADMLGAEW